MHPGYHRLSFRLKQQSPNLQSVFLPDLTPVVSDGKVNLLKDTSGYVITMIKTYHQFLNKFHIKFRPFLMGYRAFHGLTPPCPSNPQSCPTLVTLSISASHADLFCTGGPLPSFLDDLLHSSPHLNLLFAFFITLISTPFHWNGVLFYSFACLPISFHLCVVVSNDYEERDHDCDPALISST